MLVLRNSTSRYDTLRHARHAAILITRHAMLRHGAPLCNWSRRATSRLATYVSMSRYAVRRDATLRDATPFTLRHSPQPTPLTPTHATTFCPHSGFLSFARISGKKKQRLFSCSVFTFMSIAY